LYSLLCRTISVSVSNTPAGVIVPSTSTPIPSRNICGGARRACTGTSRVSSVTTKWSSFSSGFQSTVPSFTLPPRRMVAP
jgi:hypothetical protein